MLSIPVYNPAGEQVGQEQIDPADFGGAVNAQLLHEVVLMHLANRRVGTVNTRGRADVAGSGKKLFRQKGTGNARAGAKRTNKRKGGGMAFARRNRDYRYALPKKAVRIAVRMAILSKFQDRQAIVLDGLKLEAPRTREVARVLQLIPRPDLPEPAAAAGQTEAQGGPGQSAAETSASQSEALAAGTSQTDTTASTAQSENKRQARARTLDRRTILIGLPEHDPVFYRSARNIEGVQVAPVAEFNTYDILKQRYLVLTREALVKLKEAASRKVERRPAPADAAGRAEQIRGRTLSRRQRTAEATAAAPAPTES